MLTDAQVAEVVNYVRGNFGNKYKDKITAADAKAAR
jgi:mono/diheme cytochrome c family protein